MKKLSDISWNVPEEVYRQDNAYSYSLLSTYYNSGFSGLNHLFDRKESTSLTFGSAVDSIITGGIDEFTSRFIVGTFPEISSDLEKLTKAVYDSGILSSSLYDIQDDKLLKLIDSLGIYKNWKPDTRVRVVREKCDEYYKMLLIADGKTVISNDTYSEVLRTVSALKASKSTGVLFQPDNPFDNTYERFYQLKFKDTVDGIEYRCMADLLFVNNRDKVITFVDLKTSSSPEYEFFKSFLKWNYQLQSRLYWRIIRNNLDRDDFYKDYKLSNCIFAVVNKETLTPLCWEFSDTQKTGTLYYGKDNSIVLPDPYDLAKELTYYINNNCRTPIGIHEDRPNDLVTYLNTL